MQDERIAQTRACRAGCQYRHASDARSRAVPDEDGALPPLPATRFVALSSYGSSAPLCTMSQMLPIKMYHDVQIRRDAVLIMCCSCVRSSMITGGLGKALRPRSTSDAVVRWAIYHFDDDFGCTLRPACHSASTKVYVLLCSRGRCFSGHHICSTSNAEDCGTSHTCRISCC